jgi:hypothetical protein
VRAPEFRLRTPSAGLLALPWVVGNKGSRIQAYCDLLEVRWLLSEKAGRDVGTNAALAALHGDVIRTDSAAKVAVAETPTEPFEVLEMDND